MGCAAAPRFYAWTVGRARDHVADSGAAVLPAPDAVLNFSLPQMKVIRRYLSAEITTSTLLVFTALLMLFAFLDLIHELGELGKGSYQLVRIMMFVLLSV